MNPTVVAYVNATGQDVRIFHAVIMSAIAAGGVFGEDYADVFALRHAENGNWILDMA